MTLPILLCALAVGVSPAAGSGDGSLDCATGALYHFAKLNGSDVELAALGDLFPDLPSEGHSLATIQGVAARIGVELRGVKLHKHDKALSDLTIAHLDRGEQGHFVVLRPVGASGKWIQIIDPAGQPMILDKQELLESPEWTGMALVRPGRYGQTRRAGRALCLMVVIALVIWPRRVSGGKSGWLTTASAPPRSRRFQ